MIKNERIGNMKEKKVESRKKNKKRKREDV